MTNPNGLAFAIIDHLSYQLESGAVIGDSAESLEGKSQLFDFLFCAREIGRNHWRHSRTYFVVATLMICTRRFGQTVHSSDIHKTCAHTVLYVDTISGWDLLDFY